MEIESKRNSQQPDLAPILQYPLPLLSRYWDASPEERPRNLRPVWAPFVQTWLVWVVLGPVGAIEDFESLRAVQGMIWYGSILAQIRSRY